MQQVVTEAGLGGIPLDFFDLVIAVKTGESEGVQVFASVGTRRPRKRARTSSQPRRLLVQVDDPHDMETHRRIRRALNMAQPE